MQVDLDKVIKNLEHNNIKVYYTKSVAAVAPLVAQLLREGDTVSAGGSATLAETKVIDLLRGGRYRFLDRNDPTQDSEEIYFQTMRADDYLCSANAVTEAGELYFVDGNANRVSAISHGPKSVILVIGKNKLVPDLAAAVRRVKSHVAPEICKLRGRDTPCAKTGRCTSLKEGVDGMAAGCDSPERTCCTYLVLSRQRVKDRVKIILVGEDLGI